MENISPLFSDKGIIEDLQTFEYYEAYASVQLKHPPMNLSY